MFRYPIKLASGNKDVSGRKLLAYLYIQYRNSLPVRNELWLGSVGKMSVQDRTRTEWNRLGDRHVPTYIEAVSGYNSFATLSLEFQWKFEKDVPSELFETSDLTMRRDLEW